MVLISPILLLIGPILLLIGGAQGTPWALSSLRLCVLIKNESIMTQDLLIFKVKLFDV